MTYISEQAGRRSWAIQDDRKGVGYVLTVRTPHVVFPELGWFSSIEDARAQLAEAVEAEVVRVGDAEALPTPERQELISQLEEEERKVNQQIRDLWAAEDAATAQSAQQRSETEAHMQRAFEAANAGNAAEAAAHGHEAEQGLASGMALANPHLHQARSGRQHEASKVHNQIRQRLRDLRVLQGTATEEDME